MFDVVKKYYQIKPEGKWFDKDTLSFFGTRLAQFAYKKDETTYFIASEKSMRGQRLYSVRRMDKTGFIDCVDYFKSFDTMRAVKSHLADTLDCRYNDL